MYSKSLAFTVIAVATVGGLPAAVSGLAAAPAQSAGEQAAGVCRACHTLTKGGSNGVGPNLYGMFDRVAGTAPGYSFSTAMKNSKIHWTDKTLDGFLASPSKAVPGTKMPVGVADPKQRAAVISYLKTVTGKAAR